MEVAPVLWTASRRTPSATHSRIQCVTGFFPRDVKWPGRRGKSYHSPSIAKVKKAWSHESTAPYILMGAMRKYEGNFTFHVQQIKLKETTTLNCLFKHSI